MARRLGNRRVVRPAHNRASSCHGAICGQHEVARVARLVARVARSERSDGRGFRGVLRLPLRCQSYLAVHSANLREVRETPVCYEPLVGDLCIPANGASQFVHFGTQRIKAVIHRAIVSI